MTYAHEDPALAAATLNRFVTEYLKYRQEVLSGKGVAGLSEQRDVIEGRLAASDKSLRDFLARNGLSDFEAEAAASRKLFSDISDELPRSNLTRSRGQIRAHSPDRVHAEGCRSLRRNHIGGSGEAAP
jgi:uncharacterized protein involved in exopolysaccharide biosynthesis